MNALNELLATTLATSWRLGLVVLVFGLIRFSLRGRIPSQMFLLGWLIVAVALLVPLRFKVRWNPAEPPQAAVIDATLRDIPELGARESILAPAPVSALAAAFTATAPAQMTSVKPGPAPEISPGKASASWVRYSWLTVAWLAGVGVMLIRRLSAVFRLRRLLRQAPEATEPRLTGLLASCAARLGIARRPLLKLTDQVASPSICGLSRAIILLPPSVAQALDDRQLALVFTHELGHWRRRDLVVQWTIDAARVLHWFNPMAWLAARWARQDIEAACDEFVLAQESTGPADGYGLALLRVVGLSATARTEFHSLGMSEQNQPLTRRIQMIANYQPSTRLRALTGSLLLALVAFAALTKESVAQEAAKNAAPSAPMTAAPSPGKGSGVTTGAPEGWWKNGSDVNSYEVGLDWTQSKDKPVSAYVKSVVAQPVGFCGMMQMCAADNYRGKRVRLSGWVKPEDAVKGAQLWFRIDGKPVSGVPPMLGFDNMNDRRVQGTTDWIHCQVVLEVPDDADALAYGFFMTGTGKAWINNLAIEVVDQSVSTTGTYRGNPPVRTYPKEPVNLDFAAAKASR